MKKRKPAKRYGSFKKIVEKMRGGGWFYPRDLKSELKLPDRTVDYDLKAGVHIGIFKQKEKKGTYAWIDYTSEEESIRKIFEMWSPIFISDILEKEKTWKDPIEFVEEFVIKIAALETGKDPKDKEIRKICYKIAGEFFRKPTKFLSPEQRKRLLERLKKRQEPLEKVSKSP